MNAPLISILITNYNTVDFVKLSLYTLESLTANTFQVIVNDNGSKNIDIEELKKLEEQKKYLKVNYRKSKYKHPAFNHGEALNILINMIDTKYFMILDSDCVLLLKNWDQYCIDQLDDYVKVIGTQRASVDEQHIINEFPFPAPFAVFFETNIYKKLNVNCMPEGDGACYEFNKDTCWQWKEKYNNANIQSKLFYAKNTKVYQDGPFKDVYCAEYYTEQGDLICSHFRRGSSGGVAKYSTKWWFRIPFFSRFIRKYAGLKEKKEWFDICRNIMGREDKTYNFLKK